MRESCVALGGFCILQADWVAFRKVEFEELFRAIAGKLIFDNFSGVALCLKLRFS